MVKVGILVLALFALTGSVVAQQRRPDLNAFLNKKVTSVQGLVSQAETDTAVMDRFQRHYAMSRREVLSYLGSLHPARIKKDQVFNVYSVPEDDNIKVHTETLRMGTLVFADVTGTPVLIMKCGNPLNRGPKNPEILNEVDTQTVLDEEDTLREILNEDFEAPQSGEDQLMALAPGMPDVTELPVLDTTTGGESPIAILPAIVGGGLNLGPLAFLGLPFLFTGGGGGGGTPPAPVPEPATMIVMGGAVAAFIARRRR